jgi:hypothetical protein
MFFASHSSKNCQIKEVWVIYVRTQVNYLIDRHGAK